MNCTVTPLRVAGRIVAVLRGTVLDVRKKQGHLLRVPPAICLSADALAEAEGLGATEIKVTISDTDRVYQSTVANFRRFAFPIKRSGFESQMALGLAYWQIVNEGRIPWPVVATPEPMHAEAQLVLFG